MKQKRVVFIVLITGITPHLDSTLSTIIGAAELPAAILAAIWILGEQVASLQVVGIVFILVGICIPQFHIRNVPIRKQFG
ncbi:hypothetical protein [Bacillus sp. KH172YL63]|uniref:hypothetical protein n=1 Tax=Bacillus sp. KH172YL63 TaxID=2709784 RepID=UPI0013E51E5D|nr:hypothetical protein [Bacillus sp. KH172YL63]BCB02417.1 hypothetical protein KH172YL63_05500 [Bacillus sp. KH172YL63]